MTINEKSKLNSSYIIITGLLKFEEKSVDLKCLKDNYVHWKERIFDGDYEGTVKHLNNSYYDSYLNNIFPEINNSEKFKVFSKDSLNHLTHKDFIDSNQKYSVKIDEKENVEFSIDFADLFLFPHEIGIFSIKLLLNDEAFLNIGSVSGFINQIRKLDTILDIEGKQLSLKQFIESRIINCLSPEENWITFNPQLKSYIMIDLKDEVDQDELDCLLYDIGNVSKIGSSKGLNVMAPSKEYMSELLANNKISVFKNWSALSLFDTFTRISINFKDEYRSWEYDYFNLYIHCLYLKFFMYQTNTELSNVTRVTNQTEQIRDEFINFVNNYYHSHISYKFLPDLLQDKLLSSLEVPSEIERMEAKIKRINEYFQEKREKSFNKALILITLLSIVSVFYNLSEWIVSLGYPESWMYPNTSVGIAVVTIIIIYYVLKRKKRNFR